MFPCCHVQGAVHLFARSSKRRWYQQKSGAADGPAEHDERLASCRVCDGERGQEGLAESAATYRGSSSILVVKVLISSPDEDTRATQVGGVTSAILSTRWATSSRGNLCLRGNCGLNVWRRKSEGTDGPTNVGMWRRI